jgi:hypothetical protein
MQQPALTPQQQAIREVRARYERGDIPFERFEYGLNALLRAKSPAECEAILQELPAAPATVLDALTMPPPAPPAPKLPRRRWIIGVIGELQRLKRPWRMGQRTNAVMLIGELALDLSIATLPPRGVLNVYTLIGEARIYVPRDVHVSVRAFTLIGEIKALGESREGIFAFIGEEEPLAEHPSATPAPRLEIRVFSLIGEVEVKQVDAPVVTISRAAPPALLQPQ